MRKHIFLIFCLFFGVLVITSVSSKASVFPDVIDLSKPFVCKDISPAPLRITEQGLIMGGTLYPLYNPNAASSPELKNSIFRSHDNTEEIDVVQYASDGSVSVSYMKFRRNIDDLLSDTAIEQNKIFEKGSFLPVKSDPTYYSKGQGCEQYR